MNSRSDHDAGDCPDRVEEFQGLYGPYHVPERLLQKIWMRGELDLARLRTSSGKPIRITRAGEWNLLGGPDFIGADLEIDGHKMTGDVEIHFRQEDWFAHRHQHDRAYDRVVLHLVLYPPGPGSSPAVTRAGRTIETASLVDLLWHDLEEYALNETVAQVSTLSEDRSLEALLPLAPSGRRSRLIGLAEHRWAQKVHFAQIRSERLGWTQACHTTVLEVLGYSLNRPGMLAVADRFPLKTWTEPGFNSESIFETDAIPWQRQGVRPANQPRLRLSQYAALCSGDGLWTDRLLSWAETLPALPGVSPTASGQDLRKVLGLAGLRKGLLGEVIRGAIKGPRADSIAVDALLPMLAARGVAGLLGLWFSWPPGDMPAGHRVILRQIGVAGVDRAYPHAHGWFQGLLGLLLETSGQ